MSMLLNCIYLGLKFAFLRICLHCKKVGKMKKKNAWTAESKLSTGCVYYKKSQSSMSTYLNGI